MRPSERVVTRLPLGELFDEAGPVAAERGRQLGPDEVRELLREGPRRFVVADAGRPLRWVGLAETWRFWRDEVLPHLASSDPDPLNAYPGEYCYTAREWHLATGETVVALESHH